jgi:hypothetical protein
MKWHFKKGREYASWYSMKSRCLNPMNNRYKYYGGIGIKVCERWLCEDGFNNFISDMGKRPLKMSLDRFPDKCGNYEPGNCRWATAKEQAMNRRIRENPFIVEAYGKRLSVGEWVKLTKVTGSVLYQRIHRGIDPEIAVIPFVKGKKANRLTI